VNELMADRGFGDPERVFAELAGIRLSAKPLSNVLRRVAELAMDVLPDAFTGDLGRPGRTPVRDRVRAVPGCRGQRGDDHRGHRPRPALRRLRRRRTPTRGDPLPIGGLVPPAEFEHNHYRHNPTPTTAGASAPSLH